MDEKDRLADSSAAVWRQQFAAGQSLDRCRQDLIAECEVVWESIPDWATLDPGSPKSGKRS
jgi:hypothetical protein